MIGYIEGKVKDADGNTVLLLAGGVGYEIACSAAAYDALMKDGEGGIYTYLQVKEDGVSLYGFADKEEKAVFEKMISVSGVGPKLAITALMQISARDLASAIVSGDLRRLSSVKGLGKKTAERLVLDLKDAMETLGAAYPAESGKKAAPAAPSKRVEEDALLALTSLGFTRQESLQAVEEAQALGFTTAEKILSYALKHIR